jgi:hypothetical protein
MNSASFEVFTVDGGPIHAKKIEARSFSRLPYRNEKEDPWAAEYRKEIRRALAGLSCSLGEVFHALYISSDETRKCDAENILFYNVGESAFRNLAHSGLRFERWFSEPSSVKRGSASSLLFPHYYGYSVALSTDTFCFWTRGREVARFSGSGIGTLRTTPEQVWYAIKQGNLRAIGSPLPAGGRFGVTARLHCSGRTKNAARLVKPVFDGIISAFHAHNGGQINEVSARLSARLRVSGPKQILDLLTDETNAVLGARNLVWPFRKGVQWGPGDDKCVAGEMLLENRTSGQSWTLSGEIYQVEACKDREG